MPSQRRGFYECVCWIWQYRLWSFQERDTKLGKFLAKNQNYQIWRIGVCTTPGVVGVVASCQRVPKLGFQSQFAMSKIIIEEYKFRSTFFVIDIF